MQDASNLPGILAFIVALLGSIGAAAKWLLPKLALSSQVKAAETRAEKAEKRVDEALAKADEWRDKAYEARLEAAKLQVIADTATQELLKRGGGS